MPRFRPPSTEFVLIALRRPLASTLLHFVGSEHNGRNDEQEARSACRYNSTIEEGTLRAERDGQQEHTVFTALSTLYRAVCRRDIDDLRVLFEATQDLPV